MMKRLFRLILALTAAGPVVNSQDSAALPTIPDLQEMRIIQLVQGEPVRRSHPSGLPTLLAEVSSSTAFSISPDPIFIQSFEDPRLFASPVAFVNFADRADWILTPAEVEALRRYLEQGGFLYIDAGINSEFLRDDARLGQSHSFADWEVTPILEEQFKRVFPDYSFEPLPRSHPIFQGFYSGLPDPSDLPEAIRDFVVNEKWPQGSYSAMALKTKTGRIAILTTPVISLGWGRDRFGEWTSPISFRVRESAEGIDQRLSTAAFSGTRYEAVREDGSVDIIYTQPPHMPAWVQEPNGRWRVFRYYHGPEISDYAHEFYTRLGVNIFVYLLAEGP
jgi:hypothetical protein